MQGEQSWRHMGSRVADVRWSRFDAYRTQVGRTDLLEVGFRGGYIE